MTEEKIGALAARGVIATTSKAATA
jgi:hypothetical protein